MYPLNVCPADFAIEATEKIYQCHLFLVVDFSAYVRKLVVADPCLRSISVPIQGKANAFYEIFSYIYTNQIDINMENFNFIRECAIFFQSSKLIKLTSDFLARNLTIDNVFGFLNPQQTIEANQFAFDFIAQNFMQMIHDPRLLELPYNFYPPILGHQDLVYDAEEDLFKFIEELVKKNKNYFNLFSYVQFSHISGECVSNFFKLVHVENITGNLWYSIKQRLYCNPIDAPHEKDESSPPPQNSQQIPLQPQQIAQQQVQQQMYNIGMGFSPIFTNQPGWGMSQPMMDGMNSWGNPSMINQNPSPWGTSWNMQQPMMDPTGGWGMRPQMMENSTSWGFSAPVISQQGPDMQNPFQQQNVAPAPPVFTPNDVAAEEQSNDDGYEYEQESSKDYTQSQPPQQQQQPTKPERANPASQPVQKPSYGFHPQKSAESAMTQPFSELIAQEEANKPTIIPSQKLSSEDFPSFESYSNPPSNSSNKPTKTLNQRPASTPHIHSNIPQVSPWSSIPSQAVSFDQIAKSEEEKERQTKKVQEQVKEEVVEEDDVHTEKDNYYESEKQRIMSLVHPFTENYPIGADDKNLLIQGIFYRIFNILGNSPVKEGVITMNCGGTNQKSLLNLVDARTKLYWTNSTEGASTIFKEQDMWFTITFPYHKVKVTSYTFCCYIDFVNSFTPKSWKFYGSNDGKNWTLISEEKNVRQMNTISPIVNFSVIKTNKSFYSSFKFECTSNWSKNYPGKFFLSKIEFFGKVEYK